MSEQIPVHGEALRPSDLTALARSGIDAAVAESAHLRRVDSATGAQLVGRNGVGDYAGIIFPYIWPGEARVRDYRLRLDNPEIAWDHGKQRPKAKYLSPPGQRPMLYIAPGTPADYLGDISLPLIVTEGEKKGLALSTLSWHKLGDAAALPRWLAVAIPGVWSWRGKRGRVEGAHGGFDTVRGPIADLDRIAWQGRSVTILFDVNVHTNEEVQNARRALAAELRSRGARVYFVDLPADAGAEINGVDDLVGKWGADRVLDHFETTSYDPLLTCKRPVLTELGNAERLVEANGNDLMFCHPTRKWYVWDGKRFAVDQVAKVKTYGMMVVRNLQRAALNIPDKELKEAAVKFALRSESAHSINAMLELANFQEGIPVLQEDLDLGLMLLNVENGTLDLRTGNLRPHDRGDLITMLAPVSFDAAARCPRWLQFLDEVFAPHPDVIPFVQRAFGYSLTGDVREECLFLLHGTGRNGKGTLLHTLQTMLGDYASTADFSTFIARRDDRGPRDDIADMRSRRFVISIEVSEGAPLNEAMIKWHTGGDRIRGRHLYQDAMEWMPTHHLWLGVNRLPAIRGTDTGIWSRIRLIPFDVCFEYHEDKTLKQTLSSELSGILNWAVEGCLQWQRDGLGNSAAVAAATQSYRTKSDQIARFIEDECIVRDFVFARALTLYTAYKQWAEQGGEKVLPAKTFGERMSERGYPKEHKRTGTVYFKIGLRAGATDRPEDWCDR